MNAITYQQEEQHATTYAKRTSASANSNTKQKEQPSQPGSAPAKKSSVKSRIENTLGSASQTETAKSSANRDFD